MFISMNTLFATFTLDTASQQVMLDSISRICVHTSDTAKNTALCGYDWTTLSVAILALITSFAAMIYAKKTFKSQQRTEEHTQITQGNTRRISLNSQKGLMIDLVRHLYRNLVVTYAIQTKLEHLGYDKCYPSEEHLLKLKVPVESIHLDAFYNDEELYTKINRLYLLLRNYNTEIDVALSHFPRQEIDVVIKKHDLATLMFKPGFLVENIMGFLCELFHDEQDSIYRAASDVVREIAKDNQSKPQGEPWPYDFMPYEDEKSRFITSIFAHTTSKAYAADEFLDMFNTDALIECGKNDKESDKIYMIEYSNNRK